MNDTPETVRDLVCRYVVEQCRVIRDAEAPLRAGKNVIHSTRVAVRRLRSTLRVFPELFDVPQAGRLEDELTWWAGQLGEVRDLDVQGERLAGLIAELPPELVLGPVSADVQTEIAARRQVATAVMVDALDGERYRGLLALVDHWRGSAPLTPAADRPVAKINAYLKRADRKLHNRLAAAVTAGRGGDPEGGELLHRARKAGKRHRYAVELAEPLLGARAVKLIAARRDLQDVLGDHQDSLLSAEFLLDLGIHYGSRSGHNGFTYGVLYARELDAQRSLTKRLKPFLS